MFVKIVMLGLTVLTQYNYDIESSETYNEDDPELIFHRLVFSNLWLNRKVFLDFSPRYQFKLDVFIKDTLTDQSFSIYDYLIYQRSRRPIEVSGEFSIDKESFSIQITKLIQQINGIFSAQLYSVIEGKEMIIIPSVDPRDAY